jgi:hypothetical protein
MSFQRITPSKFQRPIPFNSAIGFRLASKNSWWAPVWRGLVVNKGGKHYRAMRSAVWLYLYLIVHADRKTGRLFRRTSTIASDMGVRPETIRYWMAMLRQHGYITSKTTGRALDMSVERWKRIESRHRDVYR